MSYYLADRLKAALHNQFVGRTAELALLQTALAANSITQLIYIFGPGGIGKTTLLKEFGWQCEQVGLPSLYLDAHQFQPSPAALQESLRLALALPPGEAIVPHLAARPNRTVLLIDTYERLLPLDSWLRGDFLPRLPENVLVVLAGREPPTLAWRTDPGWQSLLSILPLRNLEPVDSQSYLTRRGVPPEQQPAVLNFTHGHPLALCLVADAFSQRPNFLFQPENTPDILKILLDQFIQKVPSPAHRAALEVCALVYLTSESLLAEILQLSDAHALFEWLRTLSFINSQREGLSPHDLVRDILVADLRWRNPKWHAELSTRIRAYYTAQIQQTSGPSQQRLLLDYAYLDRDNPFLQMFYQQPLGEAIWLDGLHPVDIPHLLAMTEQHEGPESARIAAYWFERQPEGVSVFRKGQGELTGFSLILNFDTPTAIDRKTDPAIDRLWHYIQRTAPLSGGQRVSFLRFYMAAETYQTVSPTMSLILVNTTQFYLITPGLALSFIACADPDFWRPFCAAFGMERHPAADFESGGRGYGIFGYDWRRVPVVNWLALITERGAAMQAHQPAPVPLMVQPLLALNYPDFQTAVQQALRNLPPDKSSTLVGNPLLQARFVNQRLAPTDDEGERHTVLRTILREAIDSLQHTPREVKFHRVLYHTYLQPAPTQKEAAELLNLPFSTFRRHLDTGQQRIVDFLWQAEIGGPAK